MVARQDQAIDQTLEACGFEPSWFCEQVLSATNDVGLTSFIDDVGSRAAVIVIILLVAWIARRIVKRAMPRLTALVVARHDEEAKELAKREADLDEEKRIDLELRRDRVRQRAETLGGVAGSLLGGLIMFFGVLMVLDQFGINLAPLIAGAGVVGIALGFGAQQMVKDFLAGIFILLEDEYGVGDVVDTGHATGVVERVSLRVTQLRDVDGTVWYVPNGEIQRVGNRSKLWSRAVIDIDVSYDTDVDHASQVLLDVANEVWHARLPDLSIISEPEYWGVEAFGADGVTLRLVVRTEPTEQWAVARELRGRIKKAFDAEGIEIPFPQRTLWIQPSESDPSGHRERLTGAAVEGSSTSLTTAASAPATPQGAQAKEEG